MIMTRPMHKSAYRISRPYFRPYLGNMQSYLGSKFAWGKSYAHYNHPKTEFYKVETPGRGVSTNHSNSILLFSHFNRLFSGHLVEREQILTYQALGLVFIGYHQHSTTIGACMG